MSRKKTDLGKIREWAEAFLYTDIQSTKIDFVASHPFTDSWITFLPRESGIVDLHDEENSKKWREAIKKEIEETDVFGIFLMLNRPYILNFLKFSANYLSDDDLGFVLGSLWQTIEQISLDDSITGKQIVKWFERASNSKLMDEEELARLNSLPELVTVYRGVTSYNRRKKKAFSWTTDRKIAEWFANRFNTGTGEVWTITVPKERILCAFGGKEKELIVNLYGYKCNMEVEKVSSP